MARERTEGLRAWPGGTQPVWGETEPCIGLSQQVHLALPPTDRSLGDSSDPSSRSWPRAVCLVSGLRFALSAPNPGLSAHGASVLLSPRPQCIIPALGASLSFSTVALLPRVATRAPG